MIGKNEKGTNATWTTENDLQGCLIEEAEANSLVEMIRDEALPDMKVRTVRTYVSLSGMRGRVPTISSATK
jgi:hypothetical protein